MRKVVVSMNVSLNGCMAGPDGELDWHYHLWDEGMARATAMQLGNADTLLFGRVTYEAMAGYWIAKGNNAFSPREDVDFTQMMNGCNKVVFSKTLKAATWHNSRLAKNGIAEEIAGLKLTPGKDIIIYGSGKLVDALNKQNLVDEYRLWVHPVVLIKGQPLFKKIYSGLKFTGKEEFNTGVVLMTYKSLQI